MTDVDPDELRDRLDDLQWRVTQESGTDEQAFTGVCWDCPTRAPTGASCATRPCSGSDVKFESGSGWPSFWEPMEPRVIEEVSDRSRHGRTGPGAPVAAPTWATCSPTVRSRQACGTA